MSEVSEKSVPLADLAGVIRSKNAGPFEITFDVLFGDERRYELVKSSGVLNRGSICEIYNVEPSDIVTLAFVDAALAFKLTLRRPWKQGSVGEKDTFGAQQHVPLMELRVPFEPEQEN